MKKSIKRLLPVLLALCLALVAFTGTTVFATNGTHITVNSGAPTCVDWLKTGQLYILDLTTVFDNQNSDHELEYDVSSDIFGPQIYVKDVNGVPTLVFTVGTAGEYHVTISAACTDEDCEDYADHIIEFDVDPATNGSPSQYGYDETDKNSVTVFVTISNDGMPLKGSDGAILAHIPVTVPYTSLNNYGLSTYYRYGTYGLNGPYTESTVIARPTALHLFLNLLENHYVTGNNYNLLNYSNSTTVRYMDGTTAYTSSSPNKALDVSGYPTSLFFESFWGHDCNIMYFRNHVYPLMGPGWGATADYILLSDGDEIDIALYSNWEFFGDGAFLRFDEYEQSASRGDELTFSVQQYGTYVVAMGGTGYFEDTEDELLVYIYSSNGTFYDDFTWAGNSSNEYSYTLPQNMPTGLYYVVAMDPDAKTSDACLAPAVTTIIVD